MSNFDQILDQFHSNLNTLQKREAKYGLDTPLSLHDQIEDHEQAIALTGQAIAGELNEAECQQALESLLITLHRQQAVFNQQGQHVESQTNLAGDLVQIYQTVYQQPLPTDTPAYPTTLAEAERRYRDTPKAAFAEDAAAYVPLLSETTEVVTPQLPPRAARRLRKRAGTAMRLPVNPARRTRRV
jgi:hypothetical protein